MGSSKWSDDHYTARAADRAAAGTSAFAYSDTTSKVAIHDQKVHKLMDPKGVKMRESRDSDAHPTSRALGVLLDVTGSMAELPRIIQKKLPGLMGLLVKKGYVEHPQILFAAIGDATSDQAPLQVGQFESGNEMEGDLGNMFLEGRGGGHITESYELAAYFMARHTSIDCYEKRGQKGYLFFIGDEQPYDHVKSGEVKRIIGDDLQDNISTAAIFEELQKRYEVICLIPKIGAANSGSPAITNEWRKYLGQDVLQLDDAEAICEVIALHVGLREGKIDDLDSGINDLKSMGISNDIAAAASNALAPLAKSGLARPIAIGGALPQVADADTAGAHRL